MIELIAPYAHGLAFLLVLVAYLAVADARRKR